MSSTNTNFFALSQRDGPIDHLAILRGHQLAAGLHHDHYMSPSLHSSSDTYHRHLSAQIRYHDELSQGQHQRAWITKPKERKAFNELIDLLHDCAGSFLHGMGREKAEQEKEELLHGVTKQAYSKREFPEREATGMERRGWAAEDYREIKRAVVEEDSAISEPFLVRSSSTTTTTSTTSSVFDDDDESDDEYTDDDSEICLDSDNQSATNWKARTTGPQFDQSSAPLSSFCYRPGDDSDSDSEDESDDEEEPDKDKEKEEASPARQRMALFLADVLSVRSQVAIDIETDWELKVLSKHERSLHGNRTNRAHYQQLYIVSLLLHLDKNMVYTKDGKRSSLRFERKQAFGSHEVEFCGGLREELLRELEREGGSRYEAGRFVAMDDGEWGSLMEEDENFAAVRQMQHFVGQCERYGSAWEELEDVSKKARHMKDLTEFRCLEAIEEAMGY